jgi:hypothetical protein
VKSLAKTTVPETIPPRSRYVTDRRNQGRAVIS